MITDISGRCKSKSAYQTCAKIRHDITLKIGKHHHIKIIRAGNQFHTEVINDHIISFQFGKFFGYFIKTVKKKTISDLHDIGFMAAGDPLCFFLPCHFKSIAYHLHGSGSGDEAAAKCYIMREHMFDTAISIFNIFSNYSDVDWNTGFAEYGINSMQTLKYSLISKCVPCFACSYVYAFYSFAFRGFHRTFKQQSQGFNSFFGLGGHPVVESFVKHPFTHINKLIFQRNIISFKNVQNGIHYFRTNAISFSYSDLHTI